MFNCLLCIFVGVFSEVDVIQKKTLIVPSGPLGLSERG